MKLRSKKTGLIGFSGSLNTHSMSEILVNFEDGDGSSEFIKDWYVQLASGEWVALDEAFRTKAVITDNYNTTFREPANEQEKAQGWY